MFEAGFATEGTFSPDKLIVGGRLRARKVTIAAGAALVRGSVLGKITEGGKYVLSAAAAADGSQTPSAILVADAAAATADVEALIYETGDFNAKALTFGAGHTADTVRDALHDRGIFLHDTVA
jgi:hypothetical protein